MTPELTAEGLPAMATGDEFDQQTFDFDQFRAALMLLARAHSRTRQLPWIESLCRSNRKTRSGKAKKHSVAENSTC